MLTAVDFHPPQNARFLLNSSRNVYLKKSVKYNFKTRINDKWRKDGRATEAEVLRINL
jgi:hypothetical protein